jgi:hypothetical protein
VLALVGLATVQRTSPSWPGLLIGVGLPLLSIGWLNRGGRPGVCSTADCTEQYTAWPFLVAGVLLIAAGIIIARSLRERMIRRQLPAGTGWQPEGWE